MSFQDVRDAPNATVGEAGAAGEPDPRPILSARSVRKIYRTTAEDVVALDDVSIDVAQGEFVSVTGPSGSGKTTLLNCLSGLDDIDGGSVLVEGDDIHRMSDRERTRRRAATMGFVFQAFNLIPVFTVAENVELPLILVGTRPKEAEARAAETLRRVGLGHRLGRLPAELSGGEQQRVAIARALSGRPRIVWADEPTGNLDSETAMQVMDLLRELHREGLTLVLVTHDDRVAAMADRQVRMRDGRILSDGVPGAAGALPDGAAHPGAPASWQPTP